MKKLFSIHYTDTALNTALLLIRIGIGALMAQHGYDKLIHFADKHEDFMNFLGLSSEISFGLLVFAEFFCSLLLLFGFLTRLATIPLIIAMSVAVFDAHHGEIFGKGQLPTIYLLLYIVILLTGPGKLSIDAWLNNSNKT